ncbi:MAG TPA: extracellular solute-binding protein [Fimbriimonas sp.]|nr:extracellular solute-binding protein [Fimbriimonas sp.]
MVGGAAGAGWRIFLSVAAVVLPVVAFADPVEIRYSVMGADPATSQTRKVVAEFEKAHPDIRVRVDEVADEYSMRLLTEYAAGVAPDVAEMNLSMYQPFAMRGALLPLDGKEPDLNLWYPNIVRYFSWNGHLWGLPRDVSPFGLIFYNKTLFDRAGLRYPDGKWTWSYKPRPELREHDFTWVMQQLTKKDANGKTIQFGFAPDWPQLYFYLLLLSRNLTLWDNSEAPRKIVADQPDIVRLMQFANDSINKQNWIPTWDQIDTVERSTVYNEFVKGHIAMILTFASKIGDMRVDMAKAGFDWDVTLFPSYQGQPLAMGADGSGTVIFSSTKHPREALEFVRWMSGKPGQIAAAMAGSQPARRDLATQPGIWLPSANTPAGRRKPANLAITDSAALKMKYEQTPEYFEDTRLSLDNAAFDILSGSRPPEETLKRVTRESQQRLDAALRQMPTRPFPTRIAMGFVGLMIAALIGWLYWPERAVRYTKREKSESRSAYLFLAPLILGLLVFTLGPILYSLLLSLSNSDIIRAPMWVGLRNYTDAFSVDPVFWSSVRVTFTYSLIAIPLGLVMALGLALLLNVNVRGVPVYRAMYYIPSLVSGVATSLIWMRVFNPQNGVINNVVYGPDGHRNLLGLGNFLSNLAGTPGQPVNWLGNERTVLPAFVMMGMWGAGGGTIIFLAGLKGIPQAYYDAATVDGAGVWSRFRQVTLPMLSPTVFFSLVTGCIGALQVFTQSFVMTDGGPNNATLFYILNLYNQGFRSLKMGYASALGWILFAVILVVTAAQLLASKKWVYYEGAEA